MSTESTKIRKDIVKRYMEKTVKSRRLYERAKRIFPGGGTRNVANFYPYAFYTSHGSGFHVYDVDGNEYIDCNNNMCSLLHGHSFPPVLNAISSQLSKGTAHSTPTEVQLDFAQLLVNRVSSLDEIRFCASGSEATMFPLRLARVVSGQNKIIKFDGSYHGSTDYVHTNVCADYKYKNPPNLNPELGFSPGLRDHILITPINDIEYLKELISSNKDDIAAMIIEPVINRVGMSATQEYMKEVRTITQEFGIYLIFDEVITFRHALGGFQEFLDIEPDLTSFGKCIGGGLPIGAFGGKGELMEWFNPTREPHLSHSGSYNGNSISMCAGIAALQHYNQKEIDNITHWGSLLATGLKKIIQDTNFPAHVTQAGSLVYLHIFRGNYANARDYGLNLLSNYPILRYLHLELLNQGIYVYHKSCIEYILSTVMNQPLIHTILEKTREALEIVQPLFMKENNES
ncbi:MAG: aspartate aminotransferase family protein [Candidatus Lokiarchaeota archaeon]|nr:aspartate aminotransferase family protein [Candidatus Lokiarchaeota archaeon]